MAGRLLPIVYNAMSFSPWVYFNGNVHVCFAFLPKVGNTSMKSAFAELYRYEGYNPESGEGIHSLLQMVGSKENEYRKCTHIAFVRNPFDRLVSVYRDKIIDKCGNGSYYRRNKLQNISFGEFVEHVCRTPDDLADHHFAGQRYLLGSVVAQIYKLENVERDWKYVQEQIPGLPELKRLNAYERKPYRQWYTQEMVNKLNKRYETDLKRYGYEF